MTKTPVAGSEQSFFTVLGFLALTVQKRSHMRGGAHAKPVCYPLQRHSRLAPKPRGDPDFLRVALPPPAQCFGGPLEALQFLLSNPLCFCQSRLPDFLSSVQSLLNQPLRFGLSGFPQPNR